MFKSGTMRRDWFARANPGDLVWELTCDTKVQVWGGVTAPTAVVVSRAASSPMWCAGATESDEELLLEYTNNIIRHRGARRVSTSVASRYYADGTPIPASRLRGILTQVVPISNSLPTVASIRDLTGSWTLTNCTAAKDAVGLDGVASSCSTLTASGASATCLIVGGANTYRYSVYLKRKTGTGTVTAQNGATTVDVTSLINSSTWTRVSCTTADGSANGGYGILLATSGDEVYVDGNARANDYITGFGPVPIPSLTSQSVSGEPSGVTLVGVTGLSVLNNQGTFSCRMSSDTPDGAGSGSYAGKSLSGSGSMSFVQAASTVWTMHDGTATRTGDAYVHLLGVERRVTVRWSGVIANMWIDGVKSADLTFDGAMSFTSAALLASNMFFYLHHARLFREALSDAQCAAL